MVLCKSQFGLDAAGPIRLLVVDDHVIIRRGIAAILGGTEICIAGEAETAAQAIEQAKKLKPDVVLLDVRLPGPDGITAIAQIREASPEAKVIVFTAHETSSYAFRATCVCARYLMKGASKDEIIKAIRHVHCGMRLELLGLPVPKTRMSWDRWPHFDGELPLADQEMAVLRDVAQGRSNAEIGSRLEISAETVNMHVRNAMRKLDARDRTQAAVSAVKSGLI